jgi:hypothetical protein
VSYTYWDRGTAITTHCIQCGLPIAGTLYWLGARGPLCHACSHPWCSRCSGLGWVIAAGGIPVVCPSCNGTQRGSLPATAHGTPEVM